MQKTILDFKQRYKDGYIGRLLVDQRPNVAATTRKDIVRHIDKPDAKDGVSQARLSLGGTTPDKVGGKAKDKLFPIYRIDVSIQRNESELAINPSLWNQDTSLAMLECMRRENDMIINGDSTFGIDGLVDMATANTNGGITSGTNNGSWDGAETDSVMDPYADLLSAMALIDTNLQGTYYLAGRPTYLNYLLQEDDLGKIYADKIGGRLMGRPIGDTSWMVKSDYFPANYVYLILKSPEAAELVIPQDYNVDANYPREKGQNVYAEIGGWIGMEAHNNQSVVPIGIN